MDSPTLESIVRQQFDMCEKTLSVKAAEYAIPGDRLHNFKVAAQLEGKNIFEAIGGMMAKHTVSIYDMIPDGAGYSGEIWDEKITDHINYLLLLKCALIEATFPQHVPAPYSGIPNYTYDTPKDVTPRA